MSANPIEECAVDALYDELFRCGKHLRDPVPMDPKAIIRKHLTAAQQRATLVNPHTGEPRDWRDVNSDPAGVLCVKPGAPLLAAQQQGQEVAVELTRDAERYRYLRKHRVRKWVSNMERDNGDPSLDLDFSAPGYDLDAAIDVAMREAGS